MAQSDYNDSTAMQVFAVVGLLYISVKVFSFFRLLASLFVLPGISLSKFGKKGTWAVVTGASDGIGKEYALQLAAKGYNVCLLSRTQAKLDTLASEIQTKYKVETKVRAMDFAANKDADFQAVSDMLAPLDVSILVNNVGLSHSIPVPFAQTSKQEMTDIITINCFGTLRMTQIVLPGMIERKRGLVLTMASFGGIMPTPLLATYSGSKAFLQQWSTALSEEVARHGIKVQLVQSYMVVSAMSKIRHSNWLVPKPSGFVRSALAKIGRSGGSQGIAATSTPYWGHALMQWAIATFLGTMNGVVLGVNHSMMAATRKRALKKAEREAKKA